MDGTQQKEETFVWMVNQLNPGATRDRDAAVRPDGPGLKGEDARESRRECPRRADKKPRS